MEDISKCRINRIDENVAWREIESDLFIILIKDDEEKVFQLNKTASFLWKNCDGERTIQEIIEGVCLRFDVDEERARADIMRFIDEMKRLNLAVLSAP